MSAHLGSRAHRPGRWSMSAFAIREPRELDERCYTYEGNYIAGAFLGDALVRRNAHFESDVRNAALLEVPPDIEGVVECVE
ncbi:hypothetical protein ACH35V_04095 [Actinomadura sp. 1N219]|uniref:hypothetical protein n=1 Tax=Actinomadura sp. 1N219 TaxID=3375152 RepID=UPI0037B9AF98